MSKFTCAFVAATMLLVTPYLQAQTGYSYDKSRPFTEKDRDQCLKSEPPESAYWCYTFPITPVEQRQPPRHGLAPDPTTPRFNQCLDTYREVYNYVLSNCTQELDKDLLGRTNWLGLWTDEAKAAKELAWRRMEEVKQESILQRHERDAALRQSRAGQTPLQDAVDRLNDAVNAPCIYFDEHHISRSCD